MIYGAVFRSDNNTGKDNNGGGIGNVAGQLPDSVQYISIDKDAVTRFQRDVLLSHLVIQNISHGSRYLKVRMPMQRSCPIWQFCQLIVIIGDGKFCSFMGDLFP